MIAKAPKTKTKKKGKGVNDVKISRYRKDYNDLVPRKDPKTGEIYWVEKWVHPTKT